MRHRSVGLLLAVSYLLMIGGAARAGVNEWTTSGPTGRWVTAVAVDGEGEAAVFAGTGGAGVFRAEANETPRWDRVEGVRDPVVTAIAVHGKNVYVANRVGWVEVSGDGGNTWRQWGVGWSEITNLGMSNGLLLYVTFDRYFVSFPGCDRCAPPPVSKTGFVPQSLAVTTSTVWLATGDGLSISPDAAKTWKTVVIPLPGATRVVAHRDNPVVYVAHERSVASTSDGGATWRTLPSLEQEISVMAGGRNGLYVATSRDLFFYDESASAWSALGSLPSPVRALAVSHAGPAPLIYAGTPHGVFVSTADGVWKERSDGISQMSFVSDVVAAGGDSAIAATPGGAFRTADGARTWEIIEAVDDGVRTVAAGDGSLYAGGPRGIHASTDDGATWSIVTPRMPERLVASRSSRSTVYAFLQDQVEKSNDSGRTWTNLTPLFPDGGWYMFYGVLAFEADHDADVALVSYDGGGFKTTDHGWAQLWTRFDPPTAMAGLGDVVHLGWTWDVPHRGVASSTDGGRTWSERRLPQEAIQAIVIDPTNSRRAYASAIGGKVYVTEDHGRTWSALSALLPVSGIHRLSISDAGDRLLAATSAGVYELSFAAPLDALPEDAARLPRLVEQIRSRVRTSSMDGAFLLPVTGTARGAHQQTFETEVVLANGREREQSVVLAWLAQGNSRGPAVPMFRLTLPAARGDSDGVVSIGNFGSSLGLDGIGALLVVAIDTAGDLDASAEIDGSARVSSWNGAAASGTSMSVPSVAASLFAAVPRSRAVGLRHDTAHRTNAGVVNLDSNTREFTIHASGERHSERMTVSVPPFALAQTPLPDHDYGALSITVAPQGREDMWVAYGSSVNNVSGDGWAAVARPVH